jgi:hypothetical protein
VLWLRFYVTLFISVTTLYIIKFNSENSTSTSLIYLSFQIHHIVYLLDISNGVYCFETDFKIRSQLILVIVPTKMCEGDKFIYVLWRYAAVYLPFIQDYILQFYYLGFVTATIFGYICNCVQICPVIHLTNKLTNLSIQLVNAFCVALCETIRTPHMLYFTSYKFQIQYFPHYSWHLNPNAISGSGFLLITWIARFYNVGYPQSVSFV